VKGKVKEVLADEALRGGIGWFFERKKKKKREDDETRNSEVYGAIRWTEYLRL